MKPLPRNNERAVCQRPFQTQTFAAKRQRANTILTQKTRPVNPESEAQLYLDLAVGTLISLPFSRRRSLAVVAANVAILALGRKEVYPCLK